MTADQLVTKTFARAAAIAVVAVGASACSSMPDWADPTGWIGGSDKTAADTTGTTAPTPDLAAIPDKPAPPSTADERKQVAESLAADRADAQYSADALRGGTEASAAPPSDAPQVTTETLSSTAPAASAPAAEPARTASTSDDAQSSSTPNAPAAAAPAQTADVSSGSTASAASQDQGAAAPAAAAPATQVASTAPAEPSAPVAAAPSTTSDPLGFQPSRAPALDPSVANFVPKSVLDRYQESSASGAPAAEAPAPKKPDANQTSSTDDPSTDEHASARMAANTRTSKMLTPAAYTPGRATGPQTVIFFPGESTSLNAKARSQILEAAQTFQSHGGGSYIRVVGHSSSRTADMPLARHLEVVFQHSQEFASAVAHELIRDGVPADKVLIEAVGDSQPVYYESMPQGEAGNRRAEIFL